MGTAVKEKILASGQRTFRPRCLPTAALKRRRPIIRPGLATVVSYNSSADWDDVTGHVVSAATQAEITASRMRLRQQIAVCDNVAVISAPYAQ